MSTESTAAKSSFSPPSESHHLEDAAIRKRLDSLPGASQWSLKIVFPGVILALSTVLSAWFLARIIDGVFMANRAVGTLQFEMLALAGSFVLRAVTTFWCNRLGISFAAAMQSAMQRQIVEKVLRMGPRLMLGKDSARVASAALEGVDRLEGWFARYVVQKRLSVLVPVIILLAAFPFDLLSGGVLLVTAPLIPFFMVLIGNAAKSKQQKQWRFFQQLNVRFLDALKGLETVRLLGATERELDAVTEASDRFRKKTLQVLRIAFISALVLELLATLSTAVIAVETGLRLLYGKMDFFHAVFVLILAPEFYAPLRALGARHHDSMSAVEGARAVFELLDEPEGGIPDAPPYAEILEETPCAIQINDVTFRYPGTDVPVLKTISLEIGPTEKVAVVGASGSGKTTLARVLLGHLHPNEGSVICGRLKSTMPLWPQLFSWAPQQPWIFGGAILDNLTLANPAASETQIEAAIHDAMLDAFVTSLPEGAATRVGDRGQRLSGGQRQRLSIARALLRDKGVLVLDEPTSQLDPQTESVLIERLHRRLSNRPAFIIAHRWRTVELADRVIVLSDGEIALSGAPSEIRHHPLIRQLLHEGSAL